MYTTESVLASTQSQKHDTNLGANVEPREVLRDPLLPYGEHLERTIEFRALGVLLLTSHHTNHEGPKHGRRKGEDNPVEAGDPEAANVKRQPPVHSNVLQHIGLDSVVHDGLRMLLLGIHRDYREVHVRRHRANDETSSANTTRSFDFISPIQPWCRSGRSDCTDYAHAWTLFAFLLRTLFWSTCFGPKSQRFTQV